MTSSNLKAYQGVEHDKHIICQTCDDAEWAKKLVLCVEGKRKIAAILRENLAYQIREIVYKQCPTCITTTNVTKRRD